MPASKAYSMSKEDRAKSARRKRREDPVADRSGKGNKPVMVKTESVQKAIDKINRDRMTEEVLSEKNQPTNPSLWSKAKSLAKSKFDVYPSAYANGWAAKWYKSKGGGWKSVNEEKGTCWDGYTQKGMKTTGNRTVPTCVPANEAFEKFAEANGNKPSEREEATDSVDNLYRGMTPGQKKKKKLSQEAMDASVQGGYVFGADGIGPTFGVPRAGTPYGFGYGSAYSMGLSESIISWMQLERTQQKFADKYGNLWEDKLVEAALRLEEAGCGSEYSNMKKSVKKLREGMEGGVNNLSPIPTQRKDDVNEINVPTVNYQQGSVYTKRTNNPFSRGTETVADKYVQRTPSGTQTFKQKTTSQGNSITTSRSMKTVQEQQLNERGADSKGLYRPTEKGAGLTRKGAKHFGIKTAVTTPPSKLDPKGKAAKRRKSFCARMGGMKGPMKDEKGRPTRKAMSLRRWNCEE
jgi:hypothetical protein